MVVGKLHTPQEVEVHYILPALRKALTTELKSKGLSQKEIAQLLQVTEPAISQYASGKRASGVVFNERVTDAINAVAQQVNTDDELRAHTQALLKVIKDERVTCGVCKTVTSAPSDCNVCFK